MNTTVAAANFYKDIVAQPQGTHITVVQVFEDGNHKGTYGLLFIRSGSNSWTRSNGTAWTDLQMAKDFAEALQSSKIIWSFS